MIKQTALVFILLAITASSFNLLGSSSSQENVNLNKLNDQLINDEQVQKGNSITPSIQSQIKGYIQTAFIYGGNDYWKNVAWIQDKLNQKYPGDWMITIFNSTNGTPVTPNATFGISTASLNGSWWIYWRGGNHYQPTAAYYLNRQGQNTRNITTPICHSLYNMSYYYTDVFKNVLTAVQSDTDALMTEAFQIQQFLQTYSKGTSVSVLVSKKLPFYTCQWGQNDSNYIQNSPTKGNTVLSFPRVG